MKAVANTTVSILRGTTTNYAGDEIDTDTVYREGLPASLIERSQVSTQQVDGMSRTLRYATLRVRGDVDLGTDDRIRDERSGRTWTVQDVHQVRSHLDVNDITAELSRARQTP